MTPPRPLFLFGRLCFTFFVLLTGGYCLLNYVPFTYHQIHLAGLLAWVSAFTAIHHYIYWIVFIPLVLTLVPDVQRRETKYITLAFIIVFTDAGIVLLFHPLLKELPNDTRSFSWALVSLLPLLWLAVIDWLAQRRLLTWAVADGSEDDRVFQAAWRSALFLTLLYVVVFYLRYTTSVAREFGVRESGLVVFWSAVSNLLIFMSFFVILFMIRNIASLFGNSALVEFILCDLILCLLLAGVMKYLVAQQIAFEGRMATLFSVATGLSFGVFFAGLSVRLYPAEKRPVTSGLALLLTPLRWIRLLPKYGRHLAAALVFACIGVLAYVLAIRSAALDWNYLFQELCVLIIWAITFANFYDLTWLQTKETAGEFRVVVFLSAAVATLGIYKSFGLWENRLQLSANRTSAASVLESYAGYDISFKVAYDILSPPRSNPEFYRFLTENTNISQNTETHPADINLVDNLAETTGAKPNIFIFVIDSLRRDYLAPYNSAVNFTPQIAAFARASVVMQNAFTRYGGTGLSEPSIWAGALLLHKQYVTPFYPMNALQKLLEAEKYHSFISMDSILSVVVRPSASITELDNGIPERNYDFCKSLDDLESKISREKDSAARLFAYTQAQNIHVSVINREGASVPQVESYPGFYAPYASRLKRMDVCFGGFTTFLKKNGLYEKSIVILTSDHGDSLGEGGRWGHAYTIFPEILQIPMLIHLPPDLKANFSFDPRTIAFLTDVTPSLYYILGHQPTRQSELFGKPLFTKTLQEQIGYLRDSYLVASSYGPVYGILSNNGHSLYIADGVNYKDYVFDIPPDSKNPDKEVIPAIRDENERMIRDGILSINRFYHFVPPR